MGNNVVSCYTIVGQEEIDTYQMRSALFILKTVSTRLLVKMTLLAFFLFHIEDYNELVKQMKSYV